MCKLDELINELCPDGVEYKKLENIALIKRGSRVTKTELDDSKPYPVYSGGVTPMGYYEDKNQKANTITIVKYGTAGFVNFITKEFWANDVCYCILPKNEINNKFLYYLLKENQQFIKSLAIDAIPAHLPISSLRRLSIPIPPLPIQEEIVRILDTFTELTAELKAELKAELTARKKQYEYYRDKLLTFDDSVEWKEFNSIGTLIRGNGLQKKDFTESGVGCIHYGQIYTYYGLSAEETKSFVKPELAKKLRKVNTNDIIITCTSENFDDVCTPVVWLGKDEIVTGGHAMILKHNENPKYIAHYLKTSMFNIEKRKHAIGTKVIDVSATRFGKIKIPVPPLAEQERIVKILDKFDTLTNDITKGLPAEIEARQKQYEYYRDKLLTFKEKKA